MLLCVNFASAKLVISLLDLAPVYESSLNHLYCDGYKMMICQLQHSLRIYLLVLGMLLKKAAFSVICVCMCVGMCECVHTVCVT